MGYGGLGVGMMSPYSMVRLIRLHSGPGSLRMRASVAPADAVQGNGNGHGHGGYDEPDDDGHGRDGHGEYSFHCSRRIVPPR